MAGLKKDGPGQTNRQDPQWGPEKYVHERTLHIMLTQIATAAGVTPASAREGGLSSALAPARFPDPVIFEGPWSCHGRGQPRREY